VHERLAREAGIDLDATEPLEQNPFLEAFPEAGIHGLPRRRRWDAVAGAEAPDPPGEQT
jgi:hypothetical protein